MGAPCILTEAIPSKVSLSVSAVQFTEFNLKIPITCTNLPDSLQLITFPEKIKVKGTVPLNRFAGLNNNAFSASVDYYDMLKGTEKIEITLNRFSDRVHNVNYTPKKVEYIIKQ